MMELVVTDLKKSYDGRPVLDGLSFTVPVGLTRIAGNSGIGKTTLLRILLGLERADSRTEGSPLGGGLSGGPPARAPGRCGKPPLCPRRGV